MKKSVTKVLGILCTLLFTLGTRASTTNDISSHYFKKGITQVQTDSVKLVKVNEISLDDFQPIMGQIERPGPNQITLKAGAQPSILMLSSDKLSQLSEDHWLSFTRECDGNSALGISLLFWSKGNTGNRPDLTIAEGIFPGLPSTRAFPLKLLREGRGTPKTPGSLISFAFGAGLHLDEWSRFAISITDFYGGKNRTVILKDFQFTTQEPNYPIGDQVIIDEMGQWKQASFKDKFQSASEMISYLKAEAEKDMPKRESDMLGQFGGIKEKKFEASGYFRTQRDGKRCFWSIPKGTHFIVLELILSALA